VGVVKQLVQGERSYGKHFTGYLFRQHLKGLASALGGYLDGDGSWTERHGRNPYWTVGFTRKNHELAHDLRALCAMLGYRCRIGLGTSAVRKVGKRFDTYTGWIKLEEPRDNGRNLGTIVDISEGEEVTYEIEVDGAHLFCLANGLVTHNSAQIDAILRTGALSDAFTQDLEDQAEPEARTMHQQKQRIVTLLKLLGAGVRDKASYEDAVQQYTGLALVPALYQDIIHRLEACVTERLRTKGQDGAGRTRVS
jgi:hypothetical protein